MKKIMISIMLILFTSFSLIYFRNKSIFLFYGDNLDQLLPFYNHLIQQLKNLPLNLWDTSIGFGSNIFVFFFNAPLGSPFLYLALLINEEFLPQYFFWTLIVRFILTGLFSYLWVSKITKNEAARIISTLIFTFSGWAMYWIHYNTSLDFYMYIPLILYLSEEVLEDRKHIAFIIVTFLAILSSLYYFYIFTWLMIIYHIIRYLLTHNEFQLKTFYSYASKLLYLYFLAIGLGAFVIFPNISIILSSPRLGNSQTQLFSFDYSNIKLYSFLTSFISPVLSDYDTNLYVSRVLNNSVLLNYQYSFLIFPFILFPLFKMNHNKKFLLILALSFFYLVTFIPFFNVLFNGNGDKRWFVIHIVLNIMTFIFVLDNKPSKKDFIMSGILLFLIIFAFTYTSLKLNLNQESFRDDLKVNLIVSTLIIFSYTIAFLSKKYQVLLILIIASFESIYVIHQRITMHNSPKYIIADQIDLTTYYENDVYTYIKNIDSGYYRIDEYNSSSNNPINFNYAGFQFYSSVYNHSTRNILNDRFASGWNSGYTESKLLYKSLLNSKYYITPDASHIPYGYSYLNTINYDQIYKNDLDVGIGFASNRKTNINKFRELDKSLQDTYLYQTISGEFATNFTPTILPELIGNSVINDNVKLPNQDGYVLLDYSNRSYTNCFIEQYKGDQVAFSNQFTEYGYLMYKRTSDADSTYLNCTFLYNVNEQVPSNVYFYSNAFIDALYANINSFDKFYNIQVNGDSIYTEIDVKNNESIAFVNIPYDKGWNLKVDGLKQDIVIVNDGFIGFDLNGGHHTIELKFFPHLLKEGIIVSIISFISILFIKIKLLNNKF